MERCINKSSVSLTFQAYVKDDDHVWVPAEIVRKNEDQTVTVRTTKKAEPFVVKLRDYRGLELPKYCSKVDEEDLADLEHLHEAAILDNLRLRNAAGKPYTRSSATTIIATNPFEWHNDLYSQTTRQRYAEELVWKKYDEKRTRLEPHVYEISSRAYAGLMMERLNQSIIMSGESGSGKTESAKLLLHHIADISGTKGKIIPRILESHVCLEAFGNAATVRNDNSSRFAKYVQLQFDGSGPLPVLVGSFTWQYLLETARVCQHSPGERSFHIFYQLLSSPTKDQYWEKLCHKSFADFRYLVSTSINRIEGVSDSDHFNETVQALRACNVDDNVLMQAVCITLQLGNLTFGESSDSHDRTAVTSHEELQSLSELMGVSMDELTFCFTMRTMETLRGETFKVALTTAQSQEGCDALARNIYSQAFQWLIQTINKGTNSAANGIPGTIGLLDIFGFESFKINHFEQFCINYANEKLQQKAVSDIFRKTKEEYDSEGIYFKEVDYMQNESVLAIIEGKTTGIMALLNEQCLLPSGGSDRAFMQRASDQLRNSKHFVGPSSHTLFTTEFGILHYAGLVMYDAKGFVERNRNGIPQDLHNCMRKSSNQIVALNAVASPQTSLQQQEDNDYCPTAFESPGPSLLDDCDSISTRPRTIRKRCPQERANLPEKRTIAGFQHQLTKHSSVLQQPAFRPASLTATNVELISTAPRNTLEKQLVGFCPSLSENSKAKAYIKMTHSGPQPNQKHLHSKAEGILQPSKRVGSNPLKTTIWTKYQEQLISLIDTLNQTQSRYVQCIKPNHHRQPRVTDQQCTVAQLRCSGLVNIAKLSRTTFSTSLPNKVLRFRYKSMWNQTRFPSKAKRMDKADRKFKLECEALLASALEPLKVPKYRGKHDPPYAVGKTRTYFKKGILEFLEKNHILELDSVASVIQKQIRGILTRKHIADIRLALLSIQKWYRRTKADREAYLESVGGQRRRYLEARRIFDRNRSFKFQIVRA